MNTLLHSKMFAGALAGFTSAIVIDVVAFRQWKSWEDARTYNWGVATFRWFQGIVIGGLTGAGYGALIGS